MSVTEKVFADAEPIGFRVGDRVEHVALGGLDVAAAVLGDVGGLALDVALIADHTHVRGDTIDRGIPRVTGPGRATGRRDVVPVLREEFLRPCGQHSPSRGRVVQV